MIGGTRTSSGSRAAPPRGRLPAEWRLAGRERARSRGWLGPAPQRLRAPEKEAWIVQVGEIPSIELVEEVAARAVAGWPTV
eukprot:8457698-Alexandrium_andersonii.AAC.1